MSDTPPTEAASHPSLALLPLGMINVVALAGCALASWAFSAPDGRACDLYCGPTPSMFVALAIVILCSGVWLLAVAFNVTVVVAGSPRRRWGLVALAIQTLPLVTLAAVASVHS